MNREFTGTLVALGAGWLCLAQSSEAPPKFEAADVHPSAKAAGQQFVRSSTRNGRYEVKAGTMVDLIHIAYGFDVDKILGGPNWLELDRFDISAKVPPETSNDVQKKMLRSLLEERFKLVTHKDTQPLVTHVLTVGKKPQLKEAAGSGETGCKPKTASGAPTEGGMRIMSLEPGRAIHGHQSRPRHDHPVSVPQHDHGGLRRRPARHDGGEPRSQRGGG